MAMTRVGPVATKRNAPAQKVQSIRNLTKESRRIQPRQELPEALLKEFVKAINDACESGELPYHNFRLNQEGSRNRVHAHYMADALPEVYLDVARKMALKDKITMDEAVAILTDKIVDKRKKDCAFILTNDAKKFWFDIELKILYHGMKKKGEISAADKETIAKLRKLLAPGKEDALLRELGKV